MSICKHYLMAVDIDVSASSSCIQNRRPNPRFLTWSGVVVWWGNGGAQVSENRGPAIGACRLEIRSKVNLAYSMVGIWSRPTAELWEIRVGPGYCIMHVVVKRNGIDLYQVFRLSASRGCFHKLKYVFPGFPIGTLVARRPAALTSHPHHCLHTAPITALLWKPKDIYK